MHGLQQRLEEVAEVVPDLAFPGGITGSFGDTSATFATDVVPTGHQEFWANPEAVVRWRNLNAYGGAFIAFARSYIWSEHLEGVGVFRLEKSIPELSGPGTVEWMRAFGRYEHGEPLLVVFDPLLKGLSLEALLREIVDISSGLSGEASDVLIRDPQLALPTRDILRRIGPQLRQFDFSQAPEVDAFTDPDAEGPSVLRIVVRAPKTMDWNAQMRAWDRLSEFVDGLLPTDALKRRIIVSVEPS